MLQTQLIQLYYHSEGMLGNSLSEESLEVSLRETEVTHCSRDRFLLQTDFSKKVL